MHYIVPCGDIPSKTTNVSVDRYTIPDTSCYCIGHAPTSYRMLLYRAWCCQIVINVRRSWSASHPIKLFPMLLYRLRCATLWAVCQDMLISIRILESGALWSFTLSKPRFVSLPVSPLLYRSKSAKFQLCITARKIIIFGWTAPGHICSLLFSFSKSGRRNNAKSAF